MASREQLTRDAQSRGLKGREATAWVRYQMAKENLTAAQDARRAKAAAKQQPAAKRPATRKPAGSKRPSGGAFRLFGGRR
ncbi:MAG TPA: hypothetical protein VKQ30_03180 [Ktedonobacterales bacterium]|nr:hypothetical protein [Ktedonobacterales bacterium]